MVNWIKAVKRILPKHREKRFLFYYVLWVISGSLIFAFAPFSHASGIVMGYYSAINIGYSIGWSYPPQEDGPGLLFSSFYLLIGAIFVSLALGEFAEGAMKDRQIWYTKLLLRKEYEEEFSALGGGSRRKKAILFYEQYKDTIVPFALCYVWLIIMMLNGHYAAGLPWYTSLYYALTSLSTGGMVGMETAPYWSFMLHAFLTSLGIPLFGFAMGQLGMVSLKLDGDKELEETQATIAQPVAAEELEFLHRFGLENGDGYIDRDEFMILCMVRMGIDVQLLEFIGKRFEVLDLNNDGSLSIPEVTDGNYYFDENGVIAPIMLNHLSNEDIQKLMGERGDSSTSTSNNNDVRQSTRTRQSVSSVDGRQSTRSRRSTSSTSRQSTKARQGIQEFNLSNHSAKRPSRFQGQTNQLEGQPNQLQEQVSQLQEQIKKLNTYFANQSLNKNLQDELDVSASSSPGQVWRQLNEKNLLPKKIAVSATRQAQNSRQSSSDETSTDNFEDEFELPTVKQKPTPKTKNKKKSPTRNQNEHSSDESSASNEKLEVGYEVSAPQQLPSRKTKNKKIRAKKHAASASKAEQTSQQSSSKTTVPSEDEYAVSATQQTESQTSGSAARPVWKMAVDKKSGKVYYYHRITRETTWDLPPDFDEVE